MEKSLDAVAGLYGVLKAGAVCVPLDPLAPADAVAQIARDCELRVLLTGVEKCVQWPAVVEAGTSLRALVVLNRRAAGQDFLCQRFQVASLCTATPSMLNRETVVRDAPPAVRTSPTSSIPRGPRARPKAWP